MVPTSHTRAIRKLQQIVEETRRVLMEQATLEAPMAPIGQDVPIVAHVTTYTYHPLL